MRKINFLLLSCLFMASFTTVVLAKTEVKKTDNVGAMGRGYCGDGILNGNEECDGNDLNFTSCSHLNGGEGTLRCQSNCIYDISGCTNTTAMTAEVNRQIGGLAEVCSCSCDSQRCNGGCSEAGNDGTACLFDCKNDCVCNCEGKLFAHIDNCAVNCVAVTSVSGHPDVECNLSGCDLIAAISPNIGSMLNLGNGIPVSIIGGTPRFPIVGYCGDGIINGTQEDCDGTAMRNNLCRDVGGDQGQLRCTSNCTYDISDCMRAAR